MFSGVPTTSLPILSPSSHGAAGPQEKEGGDDSVGGFTPLLASASLLPIHKATMTAHQLLAIASPSCLAGPPPRHLPLPHWHPKSPRVAASHCFSRHLCPLSCHLHAGILGHPLCLCGELVTHPPSFLNSLSDSSVSSPSPHWQLPRSAGI